MLERFCQQHKIKFYTPNVDYRYFEQVINDLTKSFLNIEAEGYQVLFMGSSLGGFTSEYMAIKTQRKAIMINPAIEPAELLVQFIGVSENFELKQPYDWTQAHCDQYRFYENALKQASVKSISRTILLDMADEFIDSFKTQQKYQQFTEIIAYEGGSHSFEHIEDALSVIEKVIYT
ncbi:MAG: hypothetical protein GQ532_17010 [Methylomarinum sp.]|nr:hypothetical protein [Methylomarinum sp.]